MVHWINGTITSFKYEGELPNVVLIGNYHLLPFNNKYGPNYSESILEPYNELTKETRKILKEFSFKGKCAYIETDYFVGSGVQMTEAWFHGERIIGPDGIKNFKVPPGVVLVGDSINVILKVIEVF